MKNIYDIIAENIKLNIDNQIALQELQKRDHIVEKIKNKIIEINKECYDCNYYKTNICIEFSLRNQCVNSKVKKILKELLK